MSSDMDLDSVGCPICLEILVEPITMPCKHRMCKVSGFENQDSIIFAVAHMHCHLFFS